jgi:putative ABC transport system permease protein
MFRRVPLAWANLTHNPRRFAVSLAGVSFAVVLMFVQNGFRNALLDSTAALAQGLKADLVIVSRLNYSMALPQPFSQRRLYQAEAAEGVTSVRPLYFEFTSLNNFQKHTRQSIRVLGMDPGAEAIDLGPAHAAALKLGNAALFDRRSKPTYGFDNAHPPPTAYLAGKPVELPGTFGLSADFSTEGNLAMGSQAFAERFRRQPDGSTSLNKVDVGLVSLAPGRDPAAAKERLRELLPDDVDVLTKAEFVQREKDFWDGNTPIGFTFGFGMAMGFIVGVVICYQILSTDVTDHLPEYATLRAIGYPPRYLTRVVLEQAGLLGAVGFVPGLAVSWLIFQFLHWQTGLPMNLLPLTRPLLVFVLTVGMCMLSGVIAVRKAQTADPAEVF